MKILLTVFIVAVLIWFACFVLKRVFSVLFSIRREPAIGQAETIPRTGTVTEAAIDVTLAAKIAGALGGLVLWLAAPTGLSALAVQLGILRTPVFVTVASALVVMTVCAGVLAAAAHLFAKSQRSRMKASNSSHTEA